MQPKRQKHRKMELYKRYMLITGETSENPDGKHRISPCIMMKLLMNYYRSRLSETSMFGLNFMMLLSSKTPLTGVQG